MQHFLDNTAETNLIPPFKHRFNRFNLIPVFLWWDKIVFRTFLLLNFFFHLIFLPNLVTSCQFPSTILLFPIIWLLLTTNQGWLRLNNLRNSWSQPNDKFSNFHLSCVTGQHNTTVSNSTVSNTLLHAHIYSKR